MYCRVGNYSINEVLTFIQNIPFQKKTNIPLKLFHNFLVRPVSLRYSLFKQKGVICVKCGLEGIYFGLEATKIDIMKEVPIYHFNLYGIHNIFEVMLTKDHIYPKALGGTDDIDNLQVLCILCNEKKEILIE